MSEMNVYLNCIPCLNQGGGRIKPNHLAVQVAWGDVPSGVDHDFEYWHYVPVCDDCFEGWFEDDEPYPEPRSIPLTLDMPFQVTWAVPGEQRPPTARFAFRTHAQEFVKTVLDNVEDFQITGPEYHFEVKPLERQGKPGWGVFDEDDMPYGWWPEQIEAEAEARRLNEAMAKENEE